MSNWMTEGPPPPPGAEASSVRPVAPVADIETRQKNLYDADLIDLSPWGSPHVKSLSRMATEIVLYSEDTERFASSYGLTVKQYKKLREECSRLNEEVAAVQKGMEGGDRMTARFRDIIHANLPVLAQIMSDPSASNRDKLTAFEIAGKFAGIKPKEKEDSVPHTANQIIIHGAPPGFEIGKDDRTIEISQQDLNTQRRHLEKEAHRLDTEAAQAAEVRQAIAARQEEELEDVDEPTWEMDKSKDSTAGEHDE